MRLALLLFAVAFVCPLVAQTYPMAQQTPGQNPFTGDWNLGWEFRCNVNGLSVVQMGCHTPLTAGTTVTLFDVSSQAVVAQVNVAAGAGWKFTNLATPLTLTNGSLYRITLICINSNCHYETGSTWHPTGNIEYMQSCWVTGSNPNVYPSTSGGFGTVYGIVDIGYTLGGPQAPSATPASGSVFTGSVGAGFDMSIDFGTALANATISCTDFDTANIDATITTGGGAPGITRPGNVTAGAVPFTLTWTGTAGSTAGTYTYQVTLNDGALQTVFNVRITLIDPTLPGLLYYQFNEGSGGTAANLGGSGPATANFTATPAWNTTTNPLGAAAVSLSAENLVTGLAINTAGVTDWTLEFWINQATPTLGDIFSDNCTTIAVTIDDGTLASTAGTLFLNTSSGNLSSAAIVADGTWHHFAVSYSAATSTWQMYVDGTADASFSAGFTFGGGGIDIGNSSCWGQFVGQLDEYRLWDRVRTGAEIAADMNTELNGGDPEIDVASGATAYPDGSTQNLGTQLPGVQSSDTLTIENLGATNNLNITGISINATGAANCNVSASALTPSSPITPGSTASFDYFVTPVANGAYEFTIVIANNDVTEPSYTIIFQGTAASPEINVQRGASIADGGNDPVTGTTQATLVNLVYTIQNTGNADLALLTAAPVSVTPGTNCSAVLNGGQPASPVTPAGSVTFSVDLTPTAAGAWAFTISIANDDANEAPYDFTVTGAASAGPAPEMDVFDATPAAVANGSTVTLNGTVVAVASPATFTIQNTGTVLLNLTGATIVVVTPVTNCAATCTAQPAATVAPSGSDTFDLSVTPVATGAWSFTVSIANDDSNENPYNFTVSGTAAATAAPEIDVQRSAVSIADGGAESAANTGILPFSRTYTILNTGAAVLNLTGLPAVAISGEVNCAVTLTTPPAATVAGGGGSTTFVIQIDPTAAGTFGFTLSIANDDGNENPYNWTFNGNTAAGGGLGGGGGGGGGGGCASASGSHGWMVLLALLSILVVAIRVRASRKRDA